MVLSFDATGLAVCRYPSHLAQMLPGSHPTALAQTADGVAHLIDIKEVRVWRWVGVGRFYEET